MKQDEILHIEYEFVVSMKSLMCNRCIWFEGYYFILKLNLRVFQRTHPLSSLKKADIS